MSGKVYKQLPSRICFNAVLLQMFYPIMLDWGYVGRWHLIIHLGSIQRMHFGQHCANIILRYKMKLNEI